MDTFSAAGRPERPGRPSPAIESLPGAGQPVGPYGDRLNRPVLVNRIPRRPQWELPTAPTAPPLPAPPPLERFTIPPAVLARHQADAARAQAARQVDRGPRGAVPTAGALRARRTQLGLSQYDLARGAGMSRGHIGEIEREGHGPGRYAGARLRLAAVLDRLEAQAASRQGMTSRRDGA
jgi:DNA-binding XRE family transcriptional regulator